VDPAEIHYFFETKEQLFLAAMKPEEAASRRIAELLDEGVEQFGHRLPRRRTARATLSRCPGPGRAVVLLAAAVLALSRRQTVTRVREAS
jgi:hypothetical protein